MAAVSAGLAGRTVLITGGTGSFGQAMSRHLLDRGVGEVRILSRDEAKQDVMRAGFADPRLKFFIGDVRSRGSVRQAMKGADLVFHAAALKQVPACEFFPLEAVQTNVLGSANVVDEAVELGVDRLVCLSTDKAVYPINAMGMTKALMEKVVQAAARSRAHSDTVVCSVRYGNVMFSRGSVIPLFVRQITSGSPLTVTEPTMTRFMLALAEAVELVEVALATGGQGDTFVRKAPACTLEDLVTALQRMFGTDGPVTVIGTRHGEKIYETLATKEELRRAEDLGDYFRVRMDDRDLNYEKYFSEGDLAEASTDDYHSHNALRLGVDEMEALLAGLPEMQAALHAGG